MKILSTKWHLVPIFQYTIYFLTMALGVHIFVSIHSLKEADFLKKRIVNGTNENIWIGGKGFGRDGKWFWPDGSEFGPFENWADGQPNNPNPDDQPLECAYMQTPSRKWGDAECAADYSYPFICMF